MSFGCQSSIIHASVDSRIDIHPGWTVRADIRLDIHKITDVRVELSVQHHGYPWYTSRSDVRNTDIHADNI